MKNKNKATITFMNRNEMMAKEPVGRLIIKLTIPTITAQLINALYNIVDRIYLGHIPGAGGLVLTGVGVTFPILMLITAFANFIGAGGAPIAAIQLGSGNKEKAEDILNQGFTCLIILSVALTMFFMIFKKPLLYAFGASEITYPYANDYISTYLIGTIFVQICLGMNTFITAQGYSSFAMVTTLIGAVLNIALDPLFIFVFNMGARGAALATIISQGVSMIWVISFLRGKRTLLRLNPKKFRIKKEIMLPVFALGVSPFIMASTEAAINIVFNSTLQRTGGDIAVGAMTIIASIMSFIWMPLQGFAMGAQPVISFNFGARNNKRVSSAFKIMMITCVSYACSCTILIEAFPNIFLSAFTSDQALKEYAIPLTRIYFLGIGIFGSQMACQQTFLGLGQTKLSLFLALLRKVLLLIPLVFILSSIIGVKGVFIAEPISDITSALTAITLPISNFKKIIEKGPAQ